MKHIILSTIILLSLSMTSEAQCKAKLKKQMIMNCEGDYLMDYEINKTIELKLVLKRETVYGIYLFKEESDDMPYLIMDNKKDIQIDDYEENTDNDTYKYYKFKTPRYGTYKFTIGYKDGSSGCALLAIYSQSEKKSTTIKIDASKK